MAVAHPTPKSAGILHRQHRPIPQPLPTPRRTRRAVTRQAVHHHVARPSSTKVRSPASGRHHPRSALPRMVFPKRVLLLQDISRRRGRADFPPAAQMSGRVPTVGNQKSRVVVVVVHPLPPKISGFQPSLGRTFLSSAKCSPAIASSTSRLSAAWPASV